MWSYYNQVHPVPEKEVLQQHFDLKLAEFTSFQNQYADVDLTKPGRYSGLKRKATRYTKQRYDLKPYAAPHPSPHYLDLIKVGDHQYLHAVVWHSMPHWLNEAKRWGIVNTYSLIGKMISALGIYRLIAHERVISGFISNRFEIKMFILDHYQHRLEQFQALEKLIHTKTTGHQLKLAIKHYKKQLTKSYHPNYWAELSKRLGQFDYRYFYDVMDKGIAQDKTAINDYFQKKITMRKRLQSHGDDSLLFFIKQQTTRILSEMAALNQAVSYERNFGFTVTRGDLNSCIIDAKRALDQHQADPHNPLTDKQCGIFGADDSTQMLAFSTNERAITAISFIEGLNHIDFTCALRPLLVNTDVGQGESFPLLIEKATKWVGNESGVMILKRCGALVSHLLYGFVDLVLSPVTQLLKWFGMPGLSQYLHFLATFSLDSEDKIKWKGRGISAAARSPMISLRQRVAMLLHTCVDEIYEAMHGLWDVIHKVSGDLLRKLHLDFYVFEAREFFNLDAAELEVKAIEAMKQQQLLKYFRQQDILPDPEFVEPLAVPEFIPGVKPSRLVHNAVFRSVMQAVHFLRHYIYDRNPFVGLVFTGAYAIGGLSIVIPAAMSAAFGQLAIASKSVAVAMAKGVVSQTVSSAFTFAKVAAGITEFGLHGTRSWLFTGIKEFEKDPATSIVSITAAVALGYFLVYDAHIPVVSDEFQNDVGTVWPLATGFIAIKVAVLTYELFYAEDHHEIEVAADIERRLLAELKTLKNKKYETSEEIDLEAENALAELKGPRYKSLLKAAAEPFEILNFMQDNSRALPYLSDHLKSSMLYRIEKYWGKESPSYVVSLKKCFYPEKSSSIIRATLNRIGLYLQLVLRIPIVLIVTAPYAYCIYGHLNPVKNLYRDWVATVAEDVTETAQSIALIFQVVALCARTAMKTVYDVMMNSIVSRLFTWGTHKHQVTQMNYQITNQIDAGFNKIREVAGKPVDLMTQAVTYPHPTTISQNVSTHATLRQKLPPASSTKKWLPPEEEADLVLTPDDSFSLPSTMVTPEDSFQKSLAYLL